MRHVEDDHARYLTQWRCANERRIPELRWLFHWPQGGKRSKVTAAILKAMGVRKGPWDFWLFARRGNCPGLLIELKHGKNKLTPEQKDLGEYMVSQGWSAAVCYHWHEATQAICDYLGVQRGF
ncbi:MAG TPA: hypothetical protein VJQ83_04195 [Tepidiformaceae bacterium]|nr:hypothetical protein [Tepidiformaceae bacterium]